MPRPFFPHTMQDLINAVDGGLGLVVADMPDGSLWVLKRNRKVPGYVLTHYADAQRSHTLATEAIAERHDALNRMSAAIQLGESIRPGR